MNAASLMGTKARLCVPAILSCRPWDASTTSRYAPAGNAVFSYSGAPVAIPPGE